MTRTMDELATYEDKLFPKVNQVVEAMRRDEQYSALQRKGTAESRVEAQLRQLGIIADYDDIYSAYVSNIAKPFDDKEALKRALFLQWYSNIEPTMLTGIGNLNKDLQGDVLKEIQRLLESKDADRELIWMLRWYDSITEWYFEKFSNLSLLQEFLQDKYPNIRLATIFTDESFVGRGQMGVYWQAMFDSQKGRV